MGIDKLTSLLFSWMAVLQNGSSTTSHRELLFMNVQSLPRQYSQTVRLNPPLEVLSLTERPRPL